MNDKQQIWHLVEIETQTGTEEAVEFALNELDSLGNEIDTLGKKQTDTVSVIGYFDRKPPDNSLNDLLKDALRIHGFADGAISKVEWREIADQDWLAEWKRHWRPTTVGEFIITPPWEGPEDPHKIIISIEPNMAFGTGTHETTQLCLKAIGEHYRSGETFLDVGTGTGILAIGVAKIQGKSKKAKGKILACDTDVDSVAIARENAVLNDVGGQIDFYIGSISDETPVFDFVCANLTLDVIEPLLPMLWEKTGCVLLLSGILAEQREAIRRELLKLQISDFRFYRKTGLSKVVCKGGPRLAKPRTRPGRRRGQRISDLKAIIFRPLTDLTQPRSGLEPHNRRTFNISASIFERK